MACALELLLPLADTKYEVMGERLGELVTVLVAGCVVVPELVAWRSASEAEAAAEGEGKRGVALVQALLLTAGEAEGLKLAIGLAVWTWQPKLELLHTAPGAQAGAATSAVQLAPAATAGSQ